MSYYNTNKLTSEECHEARKKCGRQEESILRLMNARYGVPMSPEEVLNALRWVNTPLTSVRRAITNLTEKGYLRKTNLMVMGMYGKPTHTWVVNERTEQMSLV